MNPLESFDEDMEDWLDKVNSVSKAVKGLKDGSVKINDTSKLLKTLESEGQTVCDSQLIFLSLSLSLFARSTVLLY